MATILALERQQHREFEAVVVVDGSSYRTAAALHALNPSFALTVISRTTRAGPRRSTAACRPPARRSC